MPRLAPPSSGTFAKDMDRKLPRLLAVSETFLLTESNRPRSGTAEERTVPPWIFSRATESEAEAFFGVLGQWPYQLWALRTCWES